MSRRSDSMDRAAEIAGERVKDQARALGECQQALGEAEAKLAELERFRGDYATSAGAGDVRQLLNRRQFVHKIEEAIAYQRAVIMRLRRALDEQRTHWRDARARAKALDGVSGRLRAGEARTAERLEQAQLDERARQTRPWSED